MMAAVVLFLGFVATWLVFSRWSGWRRRGGKDLPPGPPGLPIVGNIFQLGVNPHKSLAELAKTYGPLMYLQLGTKDTVVVSTPQLASEILQKQVFSNRTVQDAFRIHDHDQLSMNVLPANSNRWKKLRRVSREKLFSNQALHASEGLRQERLQKLVEHVHECSDGGRAMNVGEATFTTMLNLMFATLFSIQLTKYGESDSATNKEFRAHVNTFTRYIGLPNVSDYFPILAPLDLQGINRKVRYHTGRVLETVESLIHQRLQARTASNYTKKKDFLEALLDKEGNENDLSIEEIKHLFVDLIIAGSDTSAATTEWAMVELLLHPDKLAKVRQELKSVVGDKKDIVEESDISRLPYLQATIKEVLRYRPVAPLLASRESEEETRVNGYLIPKNTSILVNFWATTRDPSIWKNPECFEPERFLDNDIGFEGQHPELVPFGSGRRICPGMPLAGRMLHCMVGTLCHNFDWKFEAGAESEKLQREDVFGLALQKKTPLRAIPVKV